jgi:hypothetical protein
MFSRARRLTRKRRFLTGLALGFATFVAAGSASAAVERPYQPRQESQPSADQAYYQSRYGASDQVRPYEPSVQPQTANAGITSPGLRQQHMLHEERDAQRAAGVPTPDYSHLPAEDRAWLVTPDPAAQQTQVTRTSSSGSGFDTGDWMRGIALAVALIAASSFAVLMVRGGARPAHS